MSTSAPKKVESLTNMNDANRPIGIFEGIFSLSNNIAQLSLMGNISFNWFPSARVVFSGSSIHTKADIMSFFEAAKSFDLIVDNFILGIFSFTHISFGEQFILEGAANASVVLGDKTVGVKNVLFSVANLRDFHGNIIKEGDDKNYVFSRGRLELDNDEYNIKLDKSNNYEELQKILRSKGGYLTLYDGLLTSKKKSISFNDSQDVFHCFSTFITFLNGRKCSALFRHGIFDGGTVWSDFTSYQVETYKHVSTWPQHISIEHVNSAWQSFYKIWQEKEDKGFLITVIHWYVEANGLSAHVEGSIILAQTALELIYNWLIVERKQLLVGKDAENISASNKIRLILSQIKVSYEVPAGLLELKVFSNSSNDIIDAPDAFVQIRNAIVHSQVDKRKKLAKISTGAQREALTLAVWYIELSLLYILKFNGKYSNRCANVEWAGQGEEHVPWVVNQA